MHARASALFSRILTPAAKSRYSHRISHCRFSFFRRHIKSINPPICRLSRVTKKIAAKKQRLFCNAKKHGAKAFYYPIKCFFNFCLRLFKHRRKRNNARFYRFESKHSERHHEKENQNQSPESERRIINRFC